MIIGVTIAAVVLAGLLLLDEYATQKWKIIYSNLLILSLLLQYGPLALPLQYWSYPVALQAIIVILCGIHIAQMNAISPEEMRNRRKKEREERKNNQPRTRTRRKS